MPPEQAAEIAARAGELWSALEAVYDRLEADVATGAWGALDVEAARLGELRCALAPVMAAMVAACEGGGDPTLRRQWTVMEARGRLLAARHRALEERAMQAREGVAAELARLRRGRGQTRQYGRPATVAPRFTSRRA